MILIDAFRDIYKNFDVFIQVLSYTWFIFLPPMLYFTFKAIWEDYIIGSYLGTITYQVLEIIPPRDVEKSPKLMESFFSGISGAISTISTSDKLTVGKIPDRFSLEIASDDGKVHFYVRIPKSYINLIEAHFYAQYPDVIIQKVPDYVENVPKIIPNAKWELWGSDFELTAPDPYPIKTYKFFEETVTGKMIDPLSALIEAMGKIGPNQKIWIQLIIVPEKEGDAVKASKVYLDKLTGKAEKHKNFGDIISELFSDFWDTLMNKPVEKKVEEKPKFNLQALTPGEQEVLKAMQDNIGKNFFKTKMRLLYLGRNENFDKGAVSSVIGAIKQFNDNNLNSFAPQDMTKTYSWYIFTESRLRYRQRRLFQRYKDRDNSTGVRFFLSTEELATVFHVPDMSVTAPNITKVEARRSGAPSNLPVQ